MKTIPVLLFLSALAAWLVLSLSVATASSLFLLAGFGCLLLTDYARPAKRYNSASVVAARPARSVNLRLAA
ncbi:MAG: hypothetical protein NVV63_03160 [Opitutus sp.]|nr:hypothetical protein [Opitutus sp.]